MLNEIESIPDGSGLTMLNSQCDILMVLFGKDDSSLTPAQVDTIRRIAANHVSYIYKDRIKEG